MWKPLVQNKIFISLVIYGGYILFRKHQIQSLTPFLHSNISEIETMTEIFKDRNYYDRKTKHLNSVQLAIISVKKSKVIFYNRVNKCGSTSMLELLGDLGFSNNFTVTGRGLPKLRTLKEKDKTRLGLFLCDESLPRMVFTRHLYFVNYSQYGCDIQYYNMVRDPVERFISRYYFHRNNFISLRGRSERIKFGNISRQLSRTLSDCVMGNFSECLYEGHPSVTKIPRTSLEQKF